MKHIIPDYIKRVTCLGIGGEDVYYIAKLYNNLGKNVLGFDIAKSHRTQDLEKKSIKVYYRNPNEQLPKSEIIVYSDSLPDSLLQDIKSKNKEKFFIEVGELKRDILNRFQLDVLPTEYKKALIKTDIFPLFNSDWGNMKLIGVTGTDGKTTVVSMIYHMLLNLGYNPGMISTVGMRIGYNKEEVGSHVTTPSAHLIQESLLNMKREGCTHAIIECSSQGIYMGRVAGLKFDVVAYTNIKREHLGYHKNWKRYVDAKSLLIRENLKNTGYAILNVDDTKAFKYLNRFGDKKLFYSIRQRKDGMNTLYVRNIHESMEGISFELSNNKINIPILGKYNVSNSLAAITVLKGLGIDEKKSSSLLNNFESVEGRMNILQKEPFKVIVDFAHTPNGLLSALKSIRKITGSDKSIILVFGCAAKRDEYKRPVMGKYAKKYANITILTAEDCRAESLEEINNQIENGWKGYKTKEEKTLIRFDNDKENVTVRKNAIKKALSLAKKGDTVLITGKGHEKSLCFGLKEYEWNEIEEVRKLIMEKRNRNRFDK